MSFDNKASGRKRTDISYSASQGHPERHSTPPVDHHPYASLLLLLSGASVLAVAGLCLITGAFLAVSGYMNSRSPTQASAEGLPDPSFGAPELGTTPSQGGKASHAGHSSVSGSSRDEISEEHLRELGLLDEGSHGAMPRSSGPSKAGLSASATRDSYRTVSGGAWSFSVPSSWNEVDTAQTKKGPPGIVKAMRAETAVDGFYPNVNLHVEPFKGSSERYYKQNLSAVKRGANITHHGPAPVPAFEVFEIEAQWSQGETPTHTLQRLISRGGQGYTLTCSTSLGSFERSRKVCRHILSSLLVRSTLN